MNKYEVLGIVGEGMYIICVAACFNLVYYKR